MNSFIEWLNSIKFSTEAIGVQKDLLLAALLGVISNLPKTLKSNFQQAVHIIVGTLLSTILTPFIMSLVGSVLGIALPTESGYGIAALIGIVGLNTIKRIFVSKLIKKEDEPQ